MANSKVIKKVKAHIGLVTDLTTGEIDGTITKGGTILVTGHNIKITNKEQGTTESIFFIGHNRIITVMNAPLLLNEPDALEFNIPSSLTPGEYTFKIKTYYSGTDDFLLKRASIMVYMLKLNVIE